MPTGITKKILSAFSFLLAGLQGLSQTVDSASITRKVYNLGEVLISATVDKATIGENDIQKYNARDLGSALRILPSIVFSDNGARNESTVYLRGFDIRSVPVFLDGIPVYVPYDGYVDLARFTLYDVARIDVAKGYSSMTYGANTIGGVINLVGMKPVKKLELNSRVGAMSGKGFETRLSLGSNLGKVYIQTDLSLLKKGFIPLSSDFPATALETDHRRDNSGQQDIKSSLKIGYTPNRTDEYSINYLYSHGSKGNPVYLGTDANTRIRYWKWPYWDKQSIYYISKSAIGSKSVLKARVYFDQFKNKISSFDDNTYTTQVKSQSFNSYYNDYSLGGNLEFSSDWNTSNYLRFSVHLKNDNHSEHNDNEPVRHFSDNTWSIGIENVYKPTGRLSFIPGVSYNLRKSLMAEDYNSAENSISNYPGNRNDALNAQLATNYTVSDAVSFNFSLAYKSRFATMKDRYSYRNGRGIPNPDLKSETAVNIELTSSVKIFRKLYFRPELFYSRLNNTIQIVDYVLEDLSQMQNTGRAEFKGIDLSLEYQPFTDFNTYLAYSIIKRENLTNPDILFTDVPRHKLFASIDYTIVKKITINLFSEYNSARKNSSDGTRVSPGYIILNSQASYRFAGYITVSLGVNNVFDRNYTIQEGYPEAGRNFYATLSFKL